MHGDRKSDGEDSSDGDTKRGDGGEEYDNGDGNSSHKSSSGDKGSTHSEISHHGNSHQNVNLIVLYENEMHKIKGALTQKVEMNILRRHRKRTDFTMTENIAI